MGLTKRKDSYYVEFRVLDDGNVLTLARGGGQLKRWKVGCLNKTAAKEHEAILKTKLLTGQIPSPGKARAQVVTFRQWATQYLALEPITRLKGYALRVACSPQFKLMTENPAAHVPKPNPQNERDRIATQEEWEQLKAVLPPHVRRFLTVAYDVGPRRGKLLSLEWSDVDMRRKEFTLRRTKNGEVRMVPMTPAVYQVFTELRQERRLDTSRVFLYKGKPIRRLNTAFKSACRRAGITNLRMHDFRHTASTNLRRAGVDTTTAMKIVGHKSERMHRRYNTIEPDDLHQAAAKLHVYRANTLITPARVAVGSEIVTSQKSSESGRSSVVES